MNELIDKIAFPQKILSSYDSACRYVAKVDGDKKSPTLH